METKEVIHQLKSELSALREQGQANVTVAGLEQYLSALEADATATAEHRNREHAGLLAQYDAQAQSDLEMFKSVIEAGRDALRLPNSTLVPTTQTYARLGSRGASAAVSAQRERWATHSEE